MTTPTRYAGRRRRPAMREIITGIQRRLQGFPPMTLGGVSYTPATLLDLFQGQLNTVNGVTSLKPQRHDAIVTEKAVRLHMTLVIQGIKALILQSSPATRKPSPTSASRPRRERCRRRSRVNRRSSSAASLPDTCTNPDPRSP